MLLPRKKMKRERAPSDEAKENGRSSDKNAYNGGMANKEMYIPLGPPPPSFSTGSVPLQCNSGFGNQILFELVGCVTVAAFTSKKLGSATYFLSENWVNFSA